MNMCNIKQSAVIQADSEMKSVSSKIEASPFISALIGFSGLLIYFAWDTSFNMQVLFPVIALVLIWYIIKTHGLILINKDFKLILGIVSVYCIALLTNSLLSPNLIHQLSFIRVFYMMIILAYYYLIMRIRFCRDDIRLILLGNVVAGVFISFLIIINWLNGASGKISLMSIFGVSIEENYTGSLVAFSAVLSFIVALNKVKLSRKIGYGISSIVMLFAICLTGSRAAILALGLGILFVFVLFLFSKNVSTKRKIILILLAAICVIVFLTCAEDILPDNLYKRIFSILNGGLKDKSNSERVNLWLFALENYIYRPFFGYGVGNFSAIVSIQPQFSHHEVVVAHNTWLDFLIDGGLVGFLLIVTLIFKNIKFLLNKKIAIFWSLIIVWLFESLIIGGERTFFFWNCVIILSILSQYFSFGDFNVKKLLS